MRSGELQVKTFSSFLLAGVIAYPIEPDQLTEVHQSWPASAGKTSLRLPNIQAGRFP
jgi:hypothetical protein